MLTRDEVKEFLLKRLPSYHVETYLMPIIDYEKKQFFNTDDILNYSYAPFPYPSIRALINLKWEVQNIKLELLESYLSPLSKKDMNFLDASVVHSCQKKLENQESILLPILWELSTNEAYQTPQYVILDGHHRIKALFNSKIRKQDFWVGFSNFC